MKHMRFVLAALFVGISLFVPFRALAQSAGTGSVAGRVSNAGTGSYLSAVEVKDKANGRTVYTDADGAYELFNLPAGQCTLTFSYGGLDRQEVTVTIIADGRVTQNVALASADYDKDLVKLEKFVVAGEREGRMASIAQQKAADVMVNMISSDEFPNVAGANLADFLRNVPGIDVVESGGDPRNIMVRGMDSQMASVTSDGMRMANAVGTSGNSRAFDMDQISIQNYETIEIYKTPTAAMEASSGGGSVNLVSKSAFNLKSARMSFQAGGMINSAAPHYPRNEGSSGDEYSIRPAWNFMYQNSFFGRRLGVTFTANYNDMYNNTKAVTNSRRAIYDYKDTLGPSWDRIGYTNGIYSRGMTYSIDSGITRRTSFSLNFDYKLTRFLKLYSNNQVNTSYISSGGQSLKVGDLDIGAPADAYPSGPSSGILASDLSPYHTTVIAGANDVRANTIQDAANSKSGASATTGLEVLNKIGKGTMFALGAEYKRNGWKINVDGGFSLSTNHYTTQDGMAINSANMYLRGIDYTIDQPANANYPILTQTSGIDMYDLSNYVSRAASGGNGPATNIIGTGRNISDADRNVIFIPGISTDKTFPLVQMARGDYGPLQVSNGRWLSTKDKFTTGKFDIKKNFSTNIPMYLQIGGLWREQTRHTDKNGQSRWFFTGSTEELQQVLEASKSPDLNATFGPYRAVPYFSLPYIDQYFKEHPEKFREDVVWRTETELTGDKFTRERITGGYGMYNIRLWRLSSLLGVRYEHTNQYTSAHISDPDAVAVMGSLMMLDYVRSYGYANITSAYNDTAINPITGQTGRQMVTGYTLTQAEALQITQARFANLTIADKSYADWFPNIQLKFDITSNLLLRGSYNKAIGRQPMDKLLPGYEVRSNSDGSYRDVIMNNPDLKPVYYSNYDVSLEYYTKKGGAWTLGYYYKMVDNYTMETEESITGDGIYSGYDLSSYDGYMLRRPFNAGEAKHWGIEASVSQRLGVFSNSLKNFMVYAMYTYQDGKTSSSYNNTDLQTGLAQRPTYMPVSGLVPKKFKISLSYNYRRVNASLSFNWVGRYASRGVYRIGPGNTEQDFTYLYNDTRSTVDGSFQYSFYKNYRFYIEAKNIGNAPVRTYYHDRRWTQNYNIYGTNIYFGIKGTF